MKRRFTEEQIIGILREQEAGGAVKEITRRHGISEQSFYRWKAKYGGMEVSRGPASAGARGGERQAQAASGRGASGQRGAEGRARPKVVRPAGKRAVATHGSAIGACMPCFAARVVGSITRRCTGSMSRRACRCANARGRGWPGTSASPCWCHRRRTSAGAGIDPIGRLQQADDARREIDDAAHRRAAASQLRAAR
jgi:hypothetical protein